jgi:dihydrodipicolinate reductase
MTVRVGIAGIRGRMGREIAALAAQDPEIALIGGLSRQPVDQHISSGEQRVVGAAADLLPGEDVRAHEQRVRELAERAVASAPGLREIVREIRTALAATATALP